MSSLLVDELARIAQEQAVLRQVATLAAGPSSSSALFGSVAEEIGDLFTVDLVLLIRYHPDATAEVVGSWRRTDDPVPVGTRSPLGGDNLTSRIAKTSAPSRMANYRDDGSEITRTALSVGTRGSAGAPILVGDSLWGSIIVQSKVGRPLPGDMETRLSQFTELVALAIASAEARSELTASRARIVVAADATRRQIERDLHDGAQQRLVSLGLELRATEAALPVDRTDLQARLAETVRGLQEVVEGIQEISRGIHPAILSRGGLGPAVRALARRSPVPVELDVRGDRRMSEQVEVAAYYVVSEALTNVAKHADASVVSISLVFDDHAVQLTIADDGVGGADPGGGSGLVGLSDRIEALGGTFDVVSPTGAGTTLAMAIPLTPPRT
jgi:signal transduction histidine kinase